MRVPPPLSSPPPTYTHSNCALPTYLRCCLAYGRSNAVSREIVRLLRCANRGMFPSQLQLYLMAVKLLLSLPAYAPPPSPACVILAAPELRALSTRYPPPPSVHPLRSCVRV